MIRYDRILPSPFALLSIVPLTVLLVAVLDLQSVINYYRLDRSSQIVHQTAGAAVTGGLSHLDHLKATNTIVTFLIWGIVGIFCFSLVQMVPRVYREFQMSKQLSSDAYLHPATFVRATFLRSVILDFVGLAVCLLGLAVLIGIFLTVALPLGLQQTRLFLLGFSWPHLPNLLYGLVIVYIWLVVCWAWLKLIWNRRRLIA